MFKLGPELLGGREARDFGGIGIEGRTDAQRVVHTVAVGVDVGKYAQRRQITTDLTQSGAGRILSFGAGARRGRSAGQVDAIGDDQIGTLKTQALTRGGGEEI